MIGPTIDKIRKIDGWMDGYIERTMRHIIWTQNPTTTTNCGLLAVPIFGKMQNNHQSGLVPRMVFFLLHIFLAFMNIHSHPHLMTKSHNIHQQW